MKLQKRTDEDQHRFGQRGILRPTDLFRARGGPTYKGKRVGEPGRYRLVAREVIRGRVYLLAQPCDRAGIPSGGTRLLMVEGKPYRLPELRDWIVKPYSIARIRETAEIAAATAATPKRKRTRRAK